MKHSVLRSKQNSQRAMTHRTLASEGEGGNQRQHSGERQLTLIEKGATPSGLRTFNDLLRNVALSTSAFRKIKG